MVVEVSFIRKKKKSFKDDVQQAQDCIYGPTIKQQPTAASHQAHVWCSAQGACSIRRPPEHLEKPQHGSPHTRLHSIPRCLAASPLQPSRSLATRFALPPPRAEKMGKRWIPLEANPDVLNQVILALPASAAGAG